MIATKLGVARSTVVKYQKKYGLKGRATGQNRKRIRGLKFGLKGTTKDGIPITDSNEVKIINAIKIWRGEGKSFQEIAGILNTQQVKTKTGKGIWHGKQSTRFLQRIVLPMQLQTSLDRSKITCINFNNSRIQLED